MEAAGPRSTAVLRELPEAEPIFIYAFLIGCRCRVRSSCIDPAAAIIRRAVIPAFYARRSPGYSIKPTGGFIGTSSFSFAHYAPCAMRPIDSHEREICRRACQQHQFPIGSNSLVVLYGFVASLPPLA